MIFWNVAGVYNKGVDFWKYVGEFDFVSLSETWVEEKSWGNLKERLPESHEWMCSYAERTEEEQREVLL